MGAVEADGNALLAGPGGEELHVEELAAAVEDGRQEDEGRRLVEAGGDLPLVEGQPVPAADENEVPGRVEPPQLEDALQGIDVRGEIEGVGDDLRPPALGLVERVDQGVDVDRRRPGHHDLVGGGADEGSAPGAETLGEMEPGRFGLEPAPDGEFLPGLDGLSERSFGIAGEQAQRVAVEVDRPGRGDEAAAGTF